MSFLTALSIGLAIGIVAGVVVYNIMNHYEMDEDKLKEWGG